MISSGNSMAGYFHATPPDARGFRTSMAVVVSVETEG
jgi:hypothetical protein